MKRLLPLLFLLSTFAFGAYQIIPESVSVGSSKPDVSASLHLTGVTKGFVPNKMTTTQRNAIATPTAGLMIYNISGNELEVYNGSGWVSVGGGGGGGGIDQWSTTQVYSVDEVVIFNQDIYLCLVGHTAGVFATDLANGYWLIISDGVSSTGTPVDMSVPRYVGTSGNVIEPSDVIVDATNNITGAASLAIGGSLDTSSILDVVSTTKGSKPCPSMSEAQRDAVATPATGLCIYNTDSLALNIYDGSAWKGVGGGLSEWETAKDYKIGDVVIESNKIYKALTNHTSVTFATDLTNNEWVELSAPQSLANYVEGPATATDNAIARYDGVTGKLVKDSLASLDNSGNLSSNTSTVTSANNGTIDLGNQTAANSSSGVLTGGVLSINADPTKIDITAGSGTFTDIWTDPANPKLYSVSWTAKTAVPVTYLATNPSSFIGIDSAGNVVQYPTSPTNSQRRDVILLGKLGHSGLTTVQNVVPQYMVAGSAMSQLRDLITEFKLINTGNIISANGANLNINKSAGSLLGLGLNYANDDKDPNKIEIASQTAATFQYRTQTGVATSNTTAIVPGSYDNGGVVTAITGSGSRATNQRIYLFPNGNIRIQYGQQVYSTLAAAIAGASGEAFVTFGNIAEDAALIGILSVTKGATALNNSSNAAFLAVSKLGEFAVGAAGFSTTNLQQAYNNSTAPQIATDATLGALDIKRGSAADTDNVLRVLNGSDISTAKITGEGRFNSTYLNADNMAKNGDVELTDITMFTCGVSNTCARTTTSGEYSKGLAALKVTTAAAAVNVSQSVTTPSGVQKQGYVRLLYKIPATITDAQICSTVDAVEQNCVPSNKLIANGLFNQIEIPLIFGTTSAGWKIKTTATYTQDVFIDNVILAQGLGTQNLMLDNVYSAKVSSTGVISDPNKTGWVTCSGSSPYTCTFQLGLFNLAPNCTATQNTANNSGFNGNIGVSSLSASNVVVRTVENNSNTNISFILTCQKSGNDYLASSANVYSQSPSSKLISATVFSANGTTTSGAIANENLDFINGNGTAANGTVMTFNAGIFTVAPNCVASPTGTSTAIISISGLTASGVTVTSYNPTTLALQASQPFNLVCQKRGVDYENAISPTIIGSFENVPVVLGSNGVKFIGGYSQTACSSGTCPITNKYGNNFTNIAFVSTGVYDVNYTGYINSPICSVGIAAIASQTNRCQLEAGPTNAKARILCLNTSHNPVNEGFWVQCFGN